MEKPDIQIYSTTIQSPVGFWHIKTTEEHLIAANLIDKPPHRASPDNELSKTAAQQLKAYFEGTLKQFDLPISFLGHTAFHQKVWKELLKIPYGQTRSYTDISLALQNPLAIRAVGLANARNPLAIIVPCHRIIGKDHSLTGYAHGLHIKKWLLEHEGALARQLDLFKL